MAISFVFFLFEPEGPCASTLASNAAVIFLVLSSLYGASFNDAMIIVASFMGMLMQEFTCWTIELAKLAAISIVLGSSFSFRRKYALALSTSLMI